MGFSWTLNMQFLKCSLCYLQAAQQIMELQEAMQISQGLQPSNIARSTSVHDMKAIVKTWKYVEILFLINIT